MKFSIGTFFKNKLLSPVQGFLLAGISPRKVAITVAVGAVLGVFPVLGTTTVLCAGAALLFRLNMPVIMMANYLVYPLQFLFLVPFMKMGEQLMGTTPFKLSLDEIVVVMQEGFLRSFEVLGWATLKGIGVWAMVAPVFVFGLYFILLPMVRRVSRVEK